MKSFAVSLIRGLMVLLSKLPLKFHYFMGDILAWLAMNVMHYRSGVVWKNLSRSFPQLKYRELKKIYKDFYKHFGEIFAEAIWFGGSCYERLRKNGIVTVMNPEEISEMYDSSPSMTVLSTHCGNWELMGGFLGYRTATGGKICFEEKDITVVYKKLKNHVFDRVFALNRIAPLVDVGTECEVESSSILRYSIQHRNEKRVYIYPTDQAPYYKSGPHPIGKFMHQDTMAMLGSVGVACRLSHSVMYMKMKQVERGRYEMTLIPICRNASESTPEEIMRKYYDLLEEEINETPHNWLWSHNRWK
ncbi:MAG: lysophospholipid acyltransferase family protein [Bacteroidales bacterium]|nr:lysophospholipid acyltransferase family protein [Bacteroidales bacterium]